MPPIRANGMKVLMNDLKNTYVPSQRQAARPNRVACVGAERPNVCAGTPSGLGLGSLALCLRAYKLISPVCACTALSKLVVALLQLLCQRQTHAMLSTLTDDSPTVAGSIMLPCTMMCRHNVILAMRSKLCAICAQCK